MHKRVGISIITLKHISGERNRKSNGHFPQKIVLGDPKLTPTHKQTNKRDTESKLQGSQLTHSNRTLSASPSEITQARHQHS